MRNYIYSGIAALTLLSAVACSRYDIKGQVVDERLWKEPRFGYIYRIEVAVQAHRTTTGPTPFVFIGTEEELKRLNKEVEIGDTVLVDDDSTAFSLSLEKVLTPDHIKVKKKGKNRRSGPIYE